MVKPLPISATTIVGYKCSNCEKSHKEPSDANICCTIKTKDWSSVQEFVLKEEHFKLLKNMYVGWDDCEFGAAEIDPKRPYGNSDVENDIGEILDYPKTKKTWDDEEEVWFEDTVDYFTDLHKQTQVALQIVLSTLSFKVGKYKRKDTYSNEWEYVGDVK